MKLLQPTAVIAALLCAGCVTQGDVQKLQSQISELQDQLAQVKRTASSKEEVENVNKKIADDTQTLLKSNATLVAKVQQIEEKMSNNQGSLEQVNYRFDKLGQQMTQAQHDIDELKAAAARAAAAAAAAPAMPAPGQPAVTGGTPPGSEVTVNPPVSGVTPVQMYQDAYRDYQRGNFDLAISGFRDFLQKYPTSDLADNASYWIGDALYSQKKYREAIRQFDSLVTKYPDSEKVPGALLKKGYAYIAIGEKANGIVQLQYVVHEHPNSTEAGLARQKLKQLGVQTR